MTEKQKSSLDWRDRIIEFKRMRIADISGHKRNPKRHPKNQADAMTGLLNEVGKADTLKAYYSEANGGKLTLWDGHLRQGLDPDQEWWIAVTDLNDSEANKMLVAFDPIAAMAEYESQQLDSLLHDVSSSDEALQAMLAGLAQEAGLYPDKPTVKDAPPAIDRAGELQKKYSTEQGQVWILGKHRLIVGDCTDKATTDRLMQGEKVGAVVTDPPYGIGIQSTVTMQSKAGGWYDAMNNAAVYTSYYRQWLSLVEDGLIWVFINWRSLPVLMKAVADLNYTHESVLIWDKEWIGPGGSKGLRPAYEMVTLLAVGNGRIADRGIPDIFRAKWSSHKPTGHQAEKPIDLMIHLVKMTEGLVYDPFVGSGTTLMACESLGRQSCCAEINPGYAATILERWHVATGVQPVRVEA